MPTGLQIPITLHIPPVFGFVAVSSSVNYAQPPSYYLSLFTSQYQNSTKLLTWAAAVYQLFADITTCISIINSRYDLNLAVGIQLDVLGVNLGISRTLPFQPSMGVSPILDDTTYRLLLRATIAKNTWDGLTASLYPIWQQLFPGGTIYINDNQNMTCTILISGGFTSIEQDLIVNGFIVPRPEAVQYTYTFATLPLFGFDLNNAQVAGFDLGHFA